MKFTILITPIAKPRMTHGDKSGYRKIVVSYWLFADELRIKAFGHRSKKWRLTRPTSFTVRAFFKDDTQQGRVGHHTIRPDADNILKACTDALFHNDQMISKMSCEKFWANGSPARLEIEWEALEHESITQAEADCSADLAGAH